MKEQFPIWENLWGELHSFCSECKNLAHWNENGQDYDDYRYFEFLQTIPRYLFSTRK